MEFVEAQQPGFLRDGGGGEPDRVVVHDLAELELVAELAHALVHVAHEFVEMRAALVCDGRGLEEQIHQHGLAATDLAEKIKSFERRRVLLIGAEQPAEG